MPACCQAAPRLISREQARHLGLERAWFSRVRLDPARNQVERALLAGDRLTVLTSAGVVHEFDANTGKTMWIAPIGNPRYPSLGPDANLRHVALLNGSTLYVLDKTNGRPIIVRPVGGAPGASPALAKEHVFVALLDGRTEGYPLGEQTISPWYFQSYGRAMVPPLATPHSIVWSTDAGHVYVGDSQKLGVRFRVETGSEIIAAPAYRPPYIYVATLSGELFAIHELTGERRWRYSAGFFVSRAPAAVGDRIFITTDEPALHCVNATKGQTLWVAPNITQFAAVSRNRVYGVDELNALVVLDAASGALLERMPTEGTNALVNDQTDRLFLVSIDGIVQCLHEIGAQEPIFHHPPETEEPPADEAAAPVVEPASPPADAEPETPTPPAFDDDPFGAMEEGDTEEQPAEEPAEAGEFGAEDDEDPFDF
jgi:outer membrane protein assembly factor BamB